MTTIRTTAVLPNVALVPEASSMPGRFKDMPLSSTLIIGGIAVAATGTVVQFARAAVGPQMLAMVGGPTASPDFSAWTGAAIALSGAVTAIFAAVSKVLIDTVVRYKAANLEADQKRDAAELEAERARAAQELEAERARSAQKIQEAQDQAKVEQDRLQALIERIAEMAETIGELRSELAEAREIVEHTDKNVSQAKDKTAAVLQKTAEQTIDNTKAIEAIRTVIAPLSSDDIPTDPSKLPS